MNDPAQLAQTSPPDANAVLQSLVAPIAAQATAAAQDAVIQAKRDVLETVASSHASSLELISGVKGQLDSLQAQVADVIATQAPVVGASAVVAVKSSLDTAQHDVWVPRLVVGIAGAFILLWAAFYFSGSHQAADLWVAVLPSIAGIVAVGGRMLVATITGASPKAGS